MITTVLTFLSQKIVAVVITTVVVVAAVPTLIVAINGNTITISTGPVASTSRHSPRPGSWCRSSRRTH